MLASAELILGLLQREQYRFSPSAVRLAIEDGSLGNVPAHELPLLGAAAAVAAGEPRRALGELESCSAADGSDEKAVAEAIRRVAVVLDRNWFPGGAGAIIDEQDLELFAGARSAKGGPHVALLVDVAWNVLAMVPTWRSIAEGSRTSGQQAAAGAVLQEVQEVGTQIAQHGAPSALGYVALIQADLFVRAGQWGAAPNVLGIAEAAYAATNDLASIGSMWLVRGDWSAEPLSHPETLGLDLAATMTHAGLAVEREPDFARQLYDQAANAFTAADAQPGLAAVELRRAHLDRLAGDWPGARRRLDAAVGLAQAAGAGAMLHLARIHRALLLIEATETPDPDALGGDVAAWVKRDGSYSYARGLARLCLASGRRWREAGDFVRGRAALRISDAINSGIGAVQEPALVSAESAELYGGVNYRRALLVLTELDLDQAIERASGKPDALAWLQLIDRVTRAYNAAVAIRDSDAIDAAAGRLDRLRQMGGALADQQDGGQSPFVTVALGAVDSFVSNAKVLAPLYRATLARSTGYLERAADYFQQALAVARAEEPAGGLMTAIVLATMGQRDAARPIVEQLVAGGQLAPDLATSLLMRVGDTAGAKAALARLDAMGRRPGQTESVGDVALRAEVHAANGEWPAAARRAEEGIAQFEERLARLSRDVLRTTAADDLDVVSLYTTAIRARLELGDGTGADAFRLSDRCRGITLADLLADDSPTADEATSAALRRWLQAGVELAQVFEGAAQRRDGDGMQLRTAIARAERKLDDAEAGLAEQAPDLWAARRRLRPTPDLSDVAALLGPETMLLQYHSFDDEVFIWTASREGARVVRRAVATAALTGEARRFHLLCADGASAEAERAALAAELAEQLLLPVSAELDAYPRVVVVPHAGLSLLPFHLLPFGGDVLGATHTVCYLPAASIAPRWHGHPRPRLGPDALIVGDPTYAPGLGLRPLPAARTEAAVIAQRLGAQALLADAATTDAVAARISQAHVLHLATHGRAIDGAPNSAEVALAGGDRLTIAELMGMDTDIDLAVLSACETGRGAATVSGDVIGLTRALLAAGARDIVVSLWPVDDLAACLTMVHFYESLEAGSDVAGALAAAQAEVRRRGAGELTAWYEELATGLAVEVGAPLSGTREWRASTGASAKAATPGHPALWGPFIHVGLQ